MTTSDPLIAAVVFDLGGVVIDIARSWRERVEAAGLPVREPARCEKALVRVHPLFMAMQRGEISTMQLAQAMSEACYGTYTPDEATLAFNSQLLAPCPGVADVVARLRCPHAIFSNTSADHWQILRELPEVRSARWPIASFQIGLAKPDPRAYAAVVAQIGCAPEQLLFFDDSEINVRAAQAQGWRAAHIAPRAVVADVLESVLNERGLLSTP